ncbi:MAG: helix-turn-helix transcriptional regulator, partial [Lachnospiraceae bacterium]|nr:helix-turn-helix transcriptional regulator [Lachnospiraceae bacterium]
MEKRESIVDKLEILAGAISYIEENLQLDIRTEDVAKACYCSKSTLEKMFRCINNISVRDYLIRRRMMFAAKMIKAQPERSVLDVALDCGYGTNESFSRAFKSIWNCNPSEFRESAHVAELYPKR